MRRYSVVCFAAILIVAAFAATAWAGSLSGTVTDESDEPLDGVTLTLYRGEDPNSADEDAWYWVAGTSTDASGDYSFASLPERRYRVHISGQTVGATLYLEADIYDVQVFQSSETPNINFVLREATVLYGYVKTAAGTPIPNARVALESPWTQWGESYHGAETDGNGMYRFHVPPSPGQFYPVVVERAWLDGTYYAAAWDYNFYKGVPGVETQIPDYLLQEAGSISGRIINESGVGIGDVEIGAFWDPECEDVGTGTGTDWDGSFHLSSVPAGVAYASLDDEGVEQGGVKYSVGNAYRGPLAIVAGEDTNIGDITIYEAGMITGLVTDEAGTPIVGAWVSAEGHDIDGNWANSESDGTDAFGQYTLDYVAPGTYVVVAWREGFSAAIKEVSLGGGEHADNADFVLKSQDDGAIVTGTITNYSEVAAQSSDGELFPYYDDSDLDDWGYRGFSILAFDMERDFTEELFLFGIFEGFFVGVAGAQLIQDGYGDFFEPDPAESAGSYGLAVPSGDAILFLATWKNFLWGAGHYAIVHDIKRFNLSKGDVLNGVDFTANLTDTGTLEGSIVVSPEYASIHPYPVEEGCVIVATKEDEPTSLPLGNALALPGWTYEYGIRELPAGTYTIRAYARDLPSVTYHGITVPSGGTITQDIVFTDGGILSGTVTASSVPVEGANVTIVETGRSAETDASGDYEIRGLNEGTYTAHVTAAAYADEEASISITDGDTTTQDFTMQTTVGSISGMVTEADGTTEINGATVVAYNADDDSFGTDETVGGAFSVTGLTPGSYLVAVHMDGYDDVVYPSSGRITLAASQELTLPEPILLGIPVPPVFTVYSSVSDTTPKILSMEFYSDQELSADPTIAVLEGTGSLDGLTVNDVKNRFEIDYTVDPADTLVRISITETSPLVPGQPASATFSFEVAEDLVATASTNFTNAIGGCVYIMLAQDNTRVCVPPFAMVGTGSDTEAVTLTIERYGDPGDPVEGADDTSASAVYDFSFDDGIDVAPNRTVTVTMSFELPTGMSEQEFESTLSIRYFDVDDQEWTTEGISNVRINWATSTIMFEVSHLSMFAAFVEAGSCLGLLGDISNDGNINTGDAILALRIAVGLNIGSPAHAADADELCSGDVNCDGNNNTGDAILILRYAVGLITEFSCGT